jgi:Ni/Co efflux regulator RcnB
MVRQPVNKKLGASRMRKLIIATVALAFVSSMAFAQTSTTPATGGDTMSKGDTMKKTTKKKKSAKKTGDDGMTKQ